MFIRHSDKDWVGYWPKSLEFRENTWQEFRDVNQMVIDVCIDGI